MIPQDELAIFGETWESNGHCLSRTPPQSSTQLGNLIDRTVGVALAEMLGGIPIIVPKRTALVPAMPNCVEVGDMRVIGGIRSQNFDAGYRPDEVRFAFDSKTLNDTESVKKNWQNMVNDLASEATTIHSKYPKGVVGFIIAVPLPCIGEARRNQMIEIFEGLGGRVNPEDQAYKAEAISFVLWNPEDGTISPDYPSPDSPLRIERFSELVERAYVARYGDGPPHDRDD